MKTKLIVSLIGAFITLMLFEPVEVSFCLWHATVCAQLRESDLCERKKVYNGVKEKK